MYKVVFTSSASKQLKKLTQSVQRLILEKIKKLDVSQPNNNIKKLVGVPDLYRLRIGDYRAVYQLRHKELVVLILKVAHRKDAYKETIRLP
jgi:mRNA interferase RelE/StbE